MTTTRPPTTRASTPPPVDAGTGPTDAGPTDAGTGVDAGTETDASAGMDAGETDAGEETDAGGETDAGSETDAGVGFDAGPDACHDLTFGRAEVPIRRVAAAELPAATGGTIPEGIYDAVDALTAGMAMGSFRASWRIARTSETTGTVDQLQQISLPMPGPIVPRSFTWTRAATNLMRTETCPGTSAFANGYAVVTEGGATRLVLREGMIAFVFELR